MGDDAGEPGQPLTPDQQAAVDLAKEAKRAGGLSPSEAKALVDQASGAGLSPAGQNSIPIALSAKILIYMLAPSTTFRFTNETLIYA
jgi:hypothetical protein